VQTRKKILCIEDDRETAALVAEELIDRGFEVRTVHSGQGGLLDIMQARPDLVLCDINMPGMTGFDVLKRLKDLAPALGRIPFVFLTVLSNRDDELKGRRLGADDYITKPIDFDRLVYIINARIGGVARTKLQRTTAQLSDREVTVLTLVARGKTSIEIARVLSLRLGHGVVRSRFIIRRAWTGSPRFAHEARAPRASSSLLARQRAT
jgi:DNA-binding response OmpR family regulator